MNPIDPDDTAAEASPVTDDPVAAAAGSSGRTASANPPGPHAQAVRSRREERLAAALRANLAKRKAALRAQKSADSERMAATANPEGAAGSVREPQ
jgi:hypothetical protein